MEQQAGGLALLGVQGTNARANRRGLRNNVQGVWRWKDVLRGGGERLERGSKR